MKYFKWIGYNAPTMLVLIAVGVPVCAVWFISLFKLIIWYSGFLFN